MKKTELSLKNQGPFEPQKYQSGSLKVDKVIIAMGIGSLVTRKGHKDFEEFERNLIKITGQKPVLVNFKRSISNFKLREGMPVMLKTIKRGERAYGISWIDFVSWFFLG